MLLVRVLVNRLLIVKFGGESKVLCEFSTEGKSGPLAPMLFKGQLYFEYSNSILFEPVRKHLRNLR